MSVNQINYSYMCNVIMAINVFCLKGTHVYIFMCQKESFRNMNDVNFSPVVGLVGEVILRGIFVVVCFLQTLPPEWLPVPLLP